jgi:hypothetical protein
MDDVLLAKASAAEGETAELDFKADFDPGSTGDWCGSLPAPQGLVKIHTRMRARLGARHHA